MSNDNYSHSLSLSTNPARLFNSLASVSPPDSPEFFTPCGTPEPRFKLPQKEAESDGARARPSNLSLPDSLPSIVKQESTPVAPDAEPGDQSPSTPLPALHRSHSADGRNELGLGIFPKQRRLSATPETSRKLAHPSENPFSKSPSTSCENIKTNSLTRRSANPLTRHETKETSHVDVCDSEDEYQVNQYIIKEDIGKGAYGQVKKVFDKQTKQMKAMKIISKKLLRRKAFQRRGFSKGSRSQSSQDEDKGIRKEIAVQKKLDHPCIVRLFEVLDDENKNEMYLVLEYLERGQVMELGQDGPISEERCRPYFVDMLLGVEYLHFQNIIHRDIKPENLLLDDHGRLKIADFGESEDVSGMHPGDQSAHKNVGTPAFYAPELTDPSAHVTKAVDVWAMGVTLYCMLFAELPFKGDSRPEIFSAIQSQPLEFPKRMVTSSDIRDLLSLMLDKCPESRIDLDGIRSHQWVDRAGYLVSKEDNCSQYIEVTDEEVNDAIRDCTTHFAALVLVKMMLQKKSFKVPAFNRMMQRAATVQEDDKPDTEELKKPRSASVRDTSDTDLSNQFSELAISLPVPERHKPAKPKTLVHQNSVHSSTGDSSPSTST